MHAQSGAVLVLVVVGAVTTVGAPRAAEWQGNVGIAETVTYDDNIGLSTASPISAWGSTTSPGLSLKFFGDALDLGFETRLDFARFPTEQRLDSNDQQARVSASYDMARTLWAVDAELVRNTSRSSEVDDTGRAILDNIRRRSIRLGPRWTYRATNADSFSVDADIQDVGFGSGQLTGFARYQGQATWSHPFTSTTAIAGSVLVSHFDPDSDIQSDVDSLSAQARISRALSRRWQASLALGLRYTTGTVGTPGGDDFESLGFLLDGSTTYTPNARTQLTGSIRRALEPSASGELVERDTVSLSVGYRWTRSIGLALGLGYQRQDNASRDPDRLQTARTYVAVEPSVSWDVTRRWVLRLSHAYRRQELDGSGTAESNAVSLVLSYQPGAWSASF